jgi:hypothetical protein
MTTSAQSASPMTFSSMRALLWQTTRRPNRVEDSLLMRDTLQWLRDLPRGIRPRHLQQRFPRIANELCRLWKDKDALEAYLGDLLVDKRGDRQGFPALVQEELQALNRFVFFDHSGMPLLIAA